MTLGDEPARHCPTAPQDTQLADALATLSRDDRTLIQLHYFEGFKTDEIAVLLGHRHATVRPQLMRARKRLKTQLSEEVQP